MEKVTFVMVVTPVCCFYIAEAHLQPLKDSCKYWSIILYNAQTNSRECGS